MTPPPATKPRPSWVILGAVTWLFLASTIVQEHGDDTAAQWGTLAAIGLATVLGLTVVSVRFFRLAARLTHHAITTLNARTRNHPR